MVAKPASNAELLVPLIRGPRFFSEHAGEKLVTAPFVADLRIVYALDKVSGFHLLHDTDLPALGVTNLLEQAIWNLAEFLPAVQRMGDKGPVYMLTAGGNFESSFLLIDEIWDQQAEFVKGHLIAAVPTFDVLLFTGSESKGGLPLIRSSVIELEQTGENPVSQTLLVRKEGKWATF